MFGGKSQLEVLTSTFGGILNSVSSIYWITRKCLADQVGCIGLRSMPTTVALMSVLRAFISFVYSNLMPMVDCLQLSSPRFLHMLAFITQILESSYQFQFRYQQYNEAVPQGQKKVFLQTLYQVRHLLNPFCGNKVSVKESHGVLNIWIPVLFLLHEGMLEMKYFKFYWENVPSHLARNILRNVRMSTSQVAAAKAQMSRRYEIMFFLV